MMLLGIVSFVDLLAPYLPKDPCCLELFARNLNHGWTSWGNEVSSQGTYSVYNDEKGVLSSQQVLKFQEISS